MTTISRTARVLIGQINKQFGKVRKFKTAEPTISVFNHLSKDETVFRKSAYKVMMAQFEVVPKATKGMGDTIFPAEQLAAKKTKLLEFAKSIGDRRLLKQVSDSQTADDLYKVCTDYNIGLFREIENVGREILATGKGKVTLEMEQAIYSLKSARAKKLFGLYEAIGKKSTNPEVLRIEKILRERYGMKNVNLQDDLARGEELLNSVKGLKAKGYPIPDNALVSDFHMAAGELVRTNGESTIILQSSDYIQRYKATCEDPDIFLPKILEKISKEDLFNFYLPIQKQMEKGVTQFSTTAPTHLVAHECLHNNHPNLISFFTGKVPARFKPTVNNISLYVNMNKNKAEIITELETKLFLTGSLKPDEMELYRHIKTGR